MTKSSAEVAGLFNAAPAAASNAPGEIYPGYPGLVVANGSIRSMVWCFPLSLKSKKSGQPLKPKPVNNARTDKLSQFFWRDSFEKLRCLIPLTAWAEAEGPRGSMTRTWLSLPDAELFAVAGVWRSSDEWGDCYSMVMKDGTGAAAEVHSRMPVILRGDQYPIWEHGSAAEALTLCELPYQRDIKVDRTTVPWVRTGR